MKILLTKTSKQWLREFKFFSFGPSFTWTLTELPMPIALDCSLHLPENIVSRAALFLPFSLLCTMLFATFVKWPMYPLRRFFWPLHKFNQTHTIIKVNLLLMLHANIVQVVFSIGLASNIIQHYDTYLLFTSRG